MWFPGLLLMLSSATQDQSGRERPPQYSLGEDLLEHDPVIQLTRVRRIFVDNLTGSDSAPQIRDLLMTSLQNSKLFIITEDEKKADAILRGAGEDSVFTDHFSSSEGINAHANVSTPGTQPSNSRYSARGVAGLSVGENESRRSDERKHEAIVTVRLVNKDGDVIWSTTQESLGGKFTGAAADVANKVAKRLAADYGAAKRQTAPAPE